MDSITHIVLGAVAGEAIAGKSLGKRAMLLGAIAQSVPDLDFIAAFFIAPADNLLVHRGFTHSFLFGILASASMAALGRRFFRTYPLPFAKWMLFFGVEIMLHLLLDACNAYGVGWLEPFSHKRFSFHLLFVVDPFYSFAPLVASVILLCLSIKSRARKFWVMFGLTVSTMYFLYAVFNKVTIAREVEDALQREQVPYKRLITTPTPFNTWLWYVVAEDSLGFYTGYRATADEKYATLRCRYSKKNDTLLAPFRTQHDVQQLIRFSQGYYTTELYGDTLIFNDLRFGQIAGWKEDEHARYVFHYYLNYPEANRLVMQRGRMAGWNRHTFSAMLRRIRGNKPNR